MRRVRATDVHQHLWPERFVTALARRERLPRVRGRVVELTGEVRPDGALTRHSLSYAEELRPLAYS